MSRRSMRTFLPTPKKSVFWSSSSKSAASPDRSVISSRLPEPPFRNASMVCEVSYR